MVPPGRISRKLKVIKTSQDFSERLIESSTIPMPNQRAPTQAEMQHGMVKARKHGGSRMLNRALAGFTKNALPRRATVTLSFPPQLSSQVRY